MNDDLRQRVFRAFSIIDGGSTDTFDSIMDAAIEDGQLTAQEFHDNEMAIATLFDDNWFTCVICGWTMPVDCMGEDVNGELACDECSPVEN